MRGLKYVDEKKCIKCRIALDCLGEKEFRTGGKTGGWHLLLGDFAQMQERIMKLEVWICPNCRRIEFFLPDERRKQ